jgi:hypothetical protein
MADRYQIDRALLAGVIAAEMDFDHDKWDSISDGIARRHWISVGEGPGVASVHEETLQHAISYLFAHSLPGHSYCDLYDRSDSNRASLEGSVEAAASVLAMYSHAYGEIHSAEDKAVIWGAFRTGIKGFIPGDINYGYGSVEDFQQHKARGTDNLPEHLQIGTNAFMSLPYFEYFGRVMANESTLRMYANSYELFGPLTDVQP